MRGADGAMGKLRRRRPEGLHEEIGGLDGDLKQAGLAGGPMMDAGGGHQVAQVVGLEVEAILQRSCGPVAIAGPDQDRGVEVSVPRPERGQ